MPDPLDSVTSFLSGLRGRVLGSIGSGMANAQNANTIAQGGLSPGEAQLALSRPDVFNATWQRQLFLNQLQNFPPEMGLNERLYRLSQEGQKQQYGITPVPGFKTPSGAEAPGAITGNQLRAPPGMGFGAAPTGTAGVQPQPTQQPAGGQQPPLSPMDQAGVNYQAAVAAAKKNAETIAAAAPDLPVLQSRSQQLIGKLQAIRDNPQLSHVVGGAQGRLPPVMGAQSDLVNDIQDANNALQGDLFTSLRATSGRGVSPGALKEMRITDLQAGRTGTLQGYKENINKTIKQIQDEYGAAWQSRGSPDTYKPNWGQSQQAASPKFQEGQTAINKQTGQRIIYTNGNWVSHP